MRATLASLFAAYLLVLGILFVPPPTSSEPLTRAELLELYARTVPPEIIAQRIGQLVNQLPAARKPAARAALRNDLEIALAQRKAAARNLIISPIEKSEIDLGESTFDEP